MKVLKKISIISLMISLITVQVVMIGVNNSYASKRYIKQLKKGNTYSYDLDGDKNKESIKVYKSKNKLLIKVNDVTNILMPYYDNDIYSEDVKIYDLNKNDNSLDILLSWSGDSEWGTKIIKFKNNKFKVNKEYKDAFLKEYNQDNGMVVFEEYDQGRYSKFVGIIGCFDCYDKVRVDGYKLYNQYTADTGINVRNNQYIASKKLTAYKDKINKKIAFTINKNDKVKVYQLYQKSNIRYIKVKNDKNQYGYVKVKLSSAKYPVEDYPSSLIFDYNSCIWSR